MVPSQDHLDELIFLNVFAEQEAENAFEKALSLMQHNLEESVLNSNLPEFDLDSLGFDKSDKEYQILAELFE